jgi:hypothetical protein
MQPGKADLTLKYVAQVDPADPTRKIEFDPMFKSLFTMDVTHHEIHESNSYTITGIKEALADGGTFFLTVITPNTTKWLHVIFQTSGLYQYYLRIYEGATVNVSGAAVTAYNRNRNSANTSGGTFRHDDTYTDNGTLIFQKYVGTGSRDGGTTDQRTEFVLKQNTTYSFQLESDAANNILSGQLEFYEHTSG